jgi:glycerol-3-phosphate dehydrogenase
LTARTWDLVVIGGGINGLGIARLAARNGYSCAVLERGDLASGTSSASSHMLHGGIRYLEHGRFSLVRESLNERSAVSHMAPGLVRPQRFLVPLYRGDRVGPWKLRAGLQMYDWFAGPAALGAHVMARRAEALALEPNIAEDGLLGAGVYSDAVMDDARIAVAVARDAAGHGAAIHTYTEATAARPADGGIDVHATDRLDGSRQVFRGRLVVNAAGPWLDSVRLMLSRSLEPGLPDPPTLLRPSRGVHLVYPRLTQGHALLLFARADGRVFFLVPFGDRSLVGTTEVEVASPPSPSAFKPSVEEIRYLRAELRRVLPGHAGVPPLAVFSGIRPLLGSDDEVGSASREHQVIETGNTLTVAGGKYTTFRVVARDVVARVQRRFGHQGRPLTDSSDPLPTSIAPEAPLERVATFAVEHEFARRVEDIVRRRTRLWLEPDRGRVAAARIAAAMAAPLGWSAERTRAEFQSYDAVVWDEESLLKRARGES